MSTFELKDAFDTILDRMEGAYNELLELRRSRDENASAVHRLTQDLRHALVQIEELSAENTQLRRDFAMAPTTAPVEPPASRQTPHRRGQIAREAGLTHRVPADLRADPVAAQEFVSGWSEIAPANDMPTIDPELVAAVDTEVPF